MTECACCGVEGDDHRLHKEIGADKIVFLCDDCTDRDYDFWVTNMRQTLKRWQDHPPAVME